MTVLKRGREEDRQVETFAMANCLMLLSRINNDNGETAAFSGRVFRCKTCHREFQSFQALGGHRASHKKPKLLTGDLFPLPSSPAKPKTHECSICGLEFAIGQALGGHMRRHRGATTTTTTTGGEKSVPVIKKSNSERVLCLDLNLTPYENDLMLGNQAPPILQLGF